MNTGSQSQMVNQWIGMAFVALICFWVVLYYFVNKTEAFANDYVFSTTSSISKY
ncbi:MAG: hypothetical protein NT077_00930 [Candidatus Taylorbacteria bacterium]|nr:hypothetical protein [Candidatus Taylorbacteria bacterium]